MQFKLDEEPSKYRVTFRDASGREESYVTVVIPDPGDPEKVKAHEIGVRNDLYLRGVTEDTMEVVRIGPQTAADRARVGSLLSGIPRQVVPE